MCQSSHLGTYSRIPRGSFERRCLAHLWIRVGDLDCVLQSGSALPGNKLSKALLRGGGCHSDHKELWASSFLCHPYLPLFPHCTHTAHEGLWKKGPFLVANVFIFTSWALMLVSFLSALVCYWLRYPVTVRWSARMSAMCTHGRLRGERGRKQSWMLLYK